MNKFKQKLTEILNGLVKIDLTYSKYLFEKQNEKFVDFRIFLRKEFNI